MINALGYKYQIPLQIARIALSKLPTWRGKNLLYFQLAEASAKRNMT